MKESSDTYNSDPFPEPRIEDDEIDERPYRITRFCSNCGRPLKRDEDGRCGECGA